MADVLTREQRSRCMSRIRGFDTGPERIVRRLLTRLGYRYCLQSKTLSGRPDIVFPGREIVIFVHGCFWHRHRCSNGRVIPKTRRSFWLRKFEANRKRDLAAMRVLRRGGWHPLVVWECQCRRDEWLAARLVSHLGSISTSRLGKGRPGYTLRDKSAGDGGAIPHDSHTSLQR